MELRVKIKGSNVIGARFGSAISSVGDLNKDSYTGILLQLVNIYWHSSLLVKYGYKIYIYFHKIAENMSIHTFALLLELLSCLEVLTTSRRLSPFGARRNDTKVPGYSIWSTDIYKGVFIDNEPGIVIT